MIISICDCYFFLDIIVVFVVLEKGGGGKLMMYVSVVKNDVVYCNCKDRLFFLIVDYDCVYLVCVIFREDIVKIKFFLLLK